MPYFITEDHCRLYYEEYGKQNEKSVVFIHGGGCNRFFYKKNVPELAKHFHVLSYDQRCHGDSEKTEIHTTIPQLAKDLKDLMEFCHMGKAVLIGHSLGSNVIWEYVKQNGCDNLAGIVVYEMSPKMINDGEWNLGFGDYQAALDYFYMQGGYFDEGYYWSARNMFGEGEVDPADVEWTIEQMKSSGYDLPIYVQCVCNDYRDVIGRITVPALITYGTWKSLYAPEVSQWLAANWGAPARLAAFEGGHFCCWQDADNWNREVIHFIAEEV